MRAFNLLDKNRLIILCFNACALACTANHGLNTDAHDANTDAGADTSAGTDTCSKKKHTDPQDARARARAHARARTHTHTHTHQPTIPKCCEEPTAIWRSSNGEKATVVH